MIRLLLVIFLISSVTTKVAALDIEQYPALVKLVSIMVEEDGYPRDALVKTLSASNVDQKIISLMNRQYEAQPWYKYRKLFINDARINKGVAFLHENQETLAAVEQKYGIPPEIITALIGIETHYGARMGNKRVLDSLVTLTADFPRRSKFFGSELRTFLNTTRKENIAPDSVMGSYAGAIGIPQFMPTSYEAYAVDFNGNGRRDLVNEMKDAIGSVGNYLHVHGWQRDTSIFVPVTAGLSSAASEKVTKRAKPKLTVAELEALSIRFDATGASKKVALLSLTEENGKRYFVGFRNFYAITRYNPSINYAMAVTELSMEISARVKN